MKTIAQQLNITEFPFVITDKDGKQIYFETSAGDWWKREFKDGKLIHFKDSFDYWSKREYKDGKWVYYEDSKGVFFGNRSEVIGKVKRWWKKR